MREDFDEFDFAEDCISENQAQRLKQRRLEDVLEEKRLERDLSDYYDYLDNVATNDREIFD